MVWQQRLAINWEKAEDASPCAQSLFLQVQSGGGLQEGLTHLQPWRQHNNTHSHIACKRVA